MIGKADAAGGISLWDEGAWTERLRGVDALVHLAGRAHVIHDRASEPLAEFRKVNVDGTRCVARAALAAGVRRFVFVSSIGVLPIDQRGYVVENSLELPREPYAISKYEAERALLELQSASDLELVIVRPPLVHGPQVKGNFLRLLRMASLGIPLPLGSLLTPRSFVGLRNLSDFLLVCTEHPAAVGQAFVVSDGDDISTAELIARLGELMNRPGRIFRVPSVLLETCMMLVGKGLEYKRLAFGPRVDLSAVRSITGWSPPQELQAGLHEMVTWFMRTRSA